MRPHIARLTATLENTKASVNELFTLPLIFAAALLSFAHGANDVANAVGPLAGINEAITGRREFPKPSIPLWVMAVGAIGISLGLALYGPKLIRTVGSEITELDKMRAYCIAMAAAITVIIASQLGLPVSSTHIAVGGVFGVGFLREYIKSNYARMLDDIRDHHANNDPEGVEAFLKRFEAADVTMKGEMLREMKAQDGQRPPARQEGTEGPGAGSPGRTGQAQPAAADRGGLGDHRATGRHLAAMFFFMLRGMLLPLILATGRGEQTRPHPHRWMFFRLERLPAQRGATMSHNHHPSAI
jgi:PiT family inorganic phosphate transporter